MDTTEIMAFLAFCVPIIIMTSLIFGSIAWCAYGGIALIANFLRQWIEAKGHCYWQRNILRESHYESN